MKFRAPLRADSQIEGKWVLAPRPFVCVGYQGHWSPVLDGVVDTGSPVTLVSSSIARELGYQVEEEAKQRESSDFDVGGQRVSAFPVNLDLAILRSSSDQVGIGLVLKGCVVYISDGNDRTVLLGQHDVLERLGFEQHNQEPVFDFVLDEIP